jgi:hypothetical protein
LCPAATCVTSVAHPHIFNVQIINRHLQGCFGLVLSTKSLKVPLPQKKNLDWLLNDSIPALEVINIELDDAQMVNWESESVEAVMKILMILLYSLCRN